MSAAPEHDQRRSPVVSAGPHEGVGGLDLDEIERRAEAASTGPWQTRTQRTADPFDPYRPDAHMVTQHGVENVARAGCAEDAEFIAHAREDVPALVAEVRRLREREAALTRAKDADLDDVRDELEALRAEREASGLLGELERTVAELERTEGDLAVAIREASRARAHVAAVDALIEQARKVSPAPSMTVYVADLDRALGREAPTPHKLGQRDDEPRCGAKSRRGFTCTLPAGHDGPRHVDRGNGPDVSWDDRWTS